MPLSQRVDRLSTPPVQPPSLRTFRSSCAVLARPGHILAPSGRLQITYAPLTMPLNGSVGGFALLQYKYHPCTQNAACAPRARLLRYHSPTAAPHRVREGYRSRKKRPPGSRAIPARFPSGFLPNFLMDFASVFAEICDRYVAGHSR